MLSLLTLAVGGLVAFGVGSLSQKGRPRLLLAVCLATTLKAGALSLFGPELTAPWSFPALPEVDGYGRLFVALFCVLTAAVALFGHPYAARRGLARDEFYGLLTWACLGMSLTAAATSWLSFFLGYELLSLCLYILVAFPKQGRVAGEAGLKYFFVGAVGSAFLAFGIAILYTATGTLDIASSASDAAAAGAADGARPWARLGLAFLLAGAALKLSLVPFHLWTPDVYQGSPAPVTALLASGSKVALFAILLRLSLAAGDGLWSVASPLLALLGALTVTVGNVGALTQRRAKRLLAYSSVAQVGYLVLALSAARQGGAAAAAFYAAVYAAMDLGAFGLLGTLSPSDREGDLDALADLRGLGRSHPWRAAALAASLLSLAGLPPMAGFIGKVWVFVAVFRAGQVLPGLLALASTVPAAYLYLRVAIALYSPRPSGDPPAPSIPKITLPEALATGTVLCALVGLGLAPSLFLSALESALTSLPGGG